ncbi:LytR C-terminal domain-containing protein [Streptomyces sp. NPDC086787]|uniref:LytR C-terminal domain-containing protein n=1 Tax=Streptomyces sp. NPDC086787 TaxID=3365759 RepID=UPI00380FB18F
MSMLTPPGMGGQYRITGDKYPRMRPRRQRGRLAFGLVAATAALGLVGWGTLQLIDVFTGGEKASAAAVKACPAAEPGVVASTAAAQSLPRPAQITVNVYNATPRTGLAKDTADELKKRGFRIGQVGNASAEFDGKVKGTGLLLGPASALRTALPVLATQLASPEQRTDAAHKGPAVDLVIGTAFKGLASPADATRALTALTSPETTRTPTNKHC